MRIHCNLKILLFVLLLTAKCQPLTAQPGTSSETALQELKSVFRNELLKSGIAEARINFGSQEGADGIYLKLSSSKEKNLPFDAFSLKATGKSLHISSSSVAGLYNGVFWYLHHLGFRYYKPNPVWHYIPRLHLVYKPVVMEGRPSFLHRRIWYAYGTGSEVADKHYDFWFKANLLGGLPVNAGHSYDVIVSRNKNEFLGHPEYFAQKVEKGKIPGNPKFNVANESLIQLCIRDAFRQIESRIAKGGVAPGMISMDPSDGGGFAKTPELLKIGGPSEQVFYLANRVAKAVGEKYPFTKIGLYAYNLHAAPPNFSLEPNIVVLIATAMNQSSFRTSELIEAWKKKGVTVGIRDYYGVMAWDWDMPGQPKGSKIAYVNQLKGHYQSGIRLFSAETNIGWISRGLGHYIASRLLWDISTDAQKLKKEFVQLMFGKGAPYMEQLYDDWEKYSQHIPLEGDLYKWYGLVDQAAKVEGNKDVQERLIQIKKYFHYVYLFMQWEKQDSDDKLFALFSYTHRIKPDGIAASYPLVRRLAGTSTLGPKRANMRWRDKNAIWKKDNSPVSEQEANRNFYEVFNSLNPTDKTNTTIYPAQYTVPALSQTNLQESPVLKFRGEHKVIFQIGSNTNATMQFSVGLIKDEKRFKSLHVAIYPYNQTLSTDGVSPVLQAKFQPSDPFQALSLGSLKEGAYIAVVNDAKSGFALKFTGAVNFGVVADAQRLTWTFSRNNMVFRVDKGVREFTVQNMGVMTLISPLGREIDLQKKTGIIPIQVKEGEDGIWKMKRQSGRVILRGIIPLLGADEKFFLTKVEKS